MDAGCLGLMDGLRRLLAGPQMDAGRGDLAQGLIGGGMPMVLGVREPTLLVASFAAGCQMALRFGVGVVDPRAKRRFWD